MFCTERELDPLIGGDYGPTSQLGAREELHSYCFNVNMMALHFMFYYIIVSYVKAGNVLLRDLLGMKLRQNVRRVRNYCYVHATSKSVYFCIYF